VLRCRNTARSWIGLPADIDASGGERPQTRRLLKRGDPVFFSACVNCLTHDPV